MDLPTMRTNVRRDLKDEVPTTQVPTAIDDCDVMWTVDGGGNSVTLDTSNKQEGSASMKVDIGAAHTTGLVCHHDISSLDFTGADYIRFWVRCLTGVNADELQLKLDDTLGCGSPVKTVNIPALVAGVWHEHQVALGDVSGCSAIVSIGLNVAVDQGAISVWLDDIRFLTNSYKWSDDELDRHIAHAVAELSIYLPYEVMADLATTPISREIDIATLTDWQRIYAVEYPIGNFPASYQRFAVWQDTITLLGDVVPDGSDARIYYGKPHTLDGSGSTIRSHHEGLVSIGAQGYALQAYAAYGIDRSQSDYRYAQERASNDAELLLRDFRQQIKRLGRHGKVRASQLYSPATQPVDNTRVLGP